MERPNSPTVVHDQRSDQRGHILSRQTPSWGGGPISGPSLDAVRGAALRVEGVAIRTPLLQADAGVWLKPEVLQPIGSFKIRGVYNWATQLTPNQRERGLVTTSAGNTAQALGYVAKMFGVKARTILPESIPVAKLAAIQRYGVQPVKVSSGELFSYMLDQKWRADPYTYLNPWGEPEMIAGSGTIGLEILEDLANVESVYVPVGGGGLISGVGSVLKAMKASVRVVGVQSEACPALAETFDVGHGVWVEAGETICDGTRVPLIVNEMVPMLRDVVDDVVLVSETEVESAIRDLASRHRLVAEGSGALAYAAARSMPESDRGTSVCVLSGGSIDSELLAGILSG